MSAGEGLRSKSELFQRVVSALVLAAAALGTAFWGGWPFALIWAVMAIAVVYEWSRIVTAGGPDFTAPATGGWLLAGVFYGVLLVTCVVLLRGASLTGFFAILFLFIVVWLTDIGAYFAGRYFGGPKFAPRISPKKTWSGVAGGILAGVICGQIVIWIASFFTPVVNRPAHVLIALILAIATVYGDLFESFLKRRFGVKDAGSIIPGHGGFLDRLDGFAAAAVVAALIGVGRGGLEMASEGLIKW